MSAARIALWDKLWFGWLVRLAALTLVLVMLTGMWFNTLPNVPAETDFPVLYASAASSRIGGSLYQHFIYASSLGNVYFQGDITRAGGPLLNENLNPPVVTFLIYPFSAYDLRTAYFLWCGVQFALALLILWRLQERLGLTHPLVRPATVLVLAAWFPVLANMLIGQLGLFLLVAIGIFVLLLLSGRERLAGVALGVALLFKLFTGLIFIALLLQRRWTILWWGALTYTLGMFIALLFFGVDDHLNWLRVLHQHQAGALSWNVSIQGICERYFGDGLIRSIYPSPWICWLLRSLAYIGTAAAFIILARWKNALGQHSASLLAIACALPLMLLLAPLGWIYYFPVLLISALICWNQLNRLTHARTLRTGLVISLVLAGIPQLLTVKHNFRPELWHTYHQDRFVMLKNAQDMLGESDTFHWFVFPEIHTLALILMAALCVRTAYRLKSTQTGA